MKVRKAVVSLFAAAAFLLAGLIPASPAEAHTQPYDSSPGMEHNLCVWFRPYSTGYVYMHFRITGTNRLCYVRIDWCYRYNILYGTRWSGPYNVTRVTCPIDA